MPADGLHGLFRNAGNTMAASVSGVEPVPIDKGSGVAVSQVVRAPAPAVGGAGTPCKANRLRGPEIGDDRSRGCRSRGRLGNSLCGSAGVWRASASSSTRHTVRRGNLEINYASSLECPVQGAIIASGALLLVLLKRVRNPTRFTHPPAVS